METSTKIIAAALPKVGNGRSEEEKEEGDKMKTVMTNYI